MRFVMGEQSGWAAGGVGSAASGGAAAWHRSLGHVTVGGPSGGCTGTGLVHWTQTITAPRKQIIMWHSLRASPTAAASPSSPCGPSSSGGK